MSNLVDISGQYFSNGQPVPFQVAIGLPEQDGPSGDYLCRVHSEQLFSRCMNVYGVSWNQAVSSAVTLVREALTRRLVKEEDVAEDHEQEAREKENKSQ
jgi:hypothetical protein